jgi:ABC-type transporter Mla subunit MlaD
MSDPNDLSPAERRAFEALARERAPRSELEDRVVAALRRRGLLAIPLAPAGAGARRRLAPWLAGALAASLALFAGGFAAGQYVGSRSGAAAALSGVQASRGDIAAVAAHAERAGAMYVAALTALSQLSDTSDAATRATARQAAITALGAAASEVAHLAPDDPLAAAVLRGLNERARAQRPEPSTRSVVWF